MLAVKRKRVVLSGICLMVLMLFILGLSIYHWKLVINRICVMDVGQGDAILLSVIGAHSLFVDTSVGR